MRDPPSLTLTDINTHNVTAVSWQKKLCTHGYDNIHINAYYCKTKGYRLCSRSVIITGETVIAAAFMVLVSAAAVLF